MSELAHDLCGLVPEWSIDWSDGSSANRYGPFIVLFDSHSNVMAYEVPRSLDERLRADFADNGAESWLIWVEDQVLSEPDYVDSDAYEYIRTELGIAV